MYCEFFNLEIYSRFFFSFQLQQLVKDLTDLSTVRENALTVREEKLQKKLILFDQTATKEQNSNTSMTRDSSVIGSEVKEQTSINLIGKVYM